ncbi:MAG: hypothetical protein IJK26_09780 [Clostridia bacterium]|nr:hypothetical protein [Clostridia bacterium]
MKRMIIALLIVFAGCFVSAIYYCTFTRFFSLFCCGLFMGWLRQFVEILYKRRKERKEKTEGDKQE